MRGEILSKAEKEGITYFSLPQWEALGFVQHGFSSRRGGTVSYTHLDVYKRQQ